jgi:hypothetical protein
MTSSSCTASLNPYLFLDHRALLNNDLVLGHRHSDLVLADLGLRGLPALNRYPLNGDLLVAGGHPYLLTVGPHILADPQLTGFALTRTGPKLFFGALYPKLILVAQAFSTAQQRRLNLLTEEVLTTARNRRIH